MRKKLGTRFPAVRSLPLLHGPSLIWLARDPICPCSRWISVRARWISPLTGALFVFLWCVLSPRRRPGGDAERAGVLLEQALVGRARNLIVLLLCLASELILSPCVEFVCGGWMDGVRWTR